MAQKGNQNAKKLTTDELKIQAYDQYCAHIAKGKDKMPAQEKALKPEQIKALVAYVRELGQDHK